MFKFETGRGNSNSSIQAASLSIRLSNVKAELFAAMP